MMYNTLIHFIFIKYMPSISYYVLPSVLPCVFFFVPILPPYSALLQYRIIFCLSNYFSQAGPSLTFYIAIYPYCADGRYSNSCKQKSCHFYIYYNYTFSIYIVTGSPVTLVDNPSFRAMMTAMDNKFKMPGLSTF